MSKYDDLKSANQLFQEFIEENCGDMMRAQMEYREKNGPTYMEKKMKEHSDNWNKMSTGTTFLVSEKYRNE